MADETPPALGLAHGKVRLADSDARWAELYEAEAARLRATIGRLVVEIQHFGSTSIEGIKAKPIIDILIGLRRFEDGEGLVIPMVALGYDYVGVDMVPNDHLFGKGAVRTHLAHAVVHGGHHWRRDLRFRDSLRADPALRVAYEQLKVELAARYPDRRDAYTAAKAEFIDPIADLH
jgi:GrpB-like predicted nucleotidyltransferase (UPF0157 family)